MASNISSPSSTASLEAYLAKYGICSSNRTHHDDDTHKPVQKRLQMLEDQLENIASQSPLYPPAPLREHDSNTGTGLGPIRSHSHPGPPHMVKENGSTLALGTSHSSKPSHTPAEQLRQEWEQLKARHVSITRGIQMGTQPSSQSQVQRLAPQQQGMSKVLGIQHGNSTQQHSPHLPCPLPLSSPALYSSQPEIALQPQVQPFSTSNTGLHQHHSPRASPFKLHVSTGVQTDESSFSHRELKPVPQQYQQQQPLDYNNQLVPQNSHQQQHQQLASLEQRLHASATRSPADQDVPLSEPAKQQLLDSQGLQEAVQAALLSIMSQPPPCLLPILTSMQQQQSHYLQPLMSPWTSSPMPSWPNWPQAATNDCSTPTAANSQLPSHLDHERHAPTQQKPFPLATTHTNQHPIQQHPIQQLAPSASPPPHPSTPDLDPWSASQAVDAKPGTGWRAAAAVAAGARGAPATRMGLQQADAYRTPSSNTSPSIAAAAALSAHANKTKSAQHGDATAAYNSKVQHASLPPLPPLLAARLAEHMRRKQHRLHPQPDSPPSSAASVADSIPCSLPWRPQRASAARQKAARPARWRESVQMLAHDSSKGSA